MTKENNEGLFQEQAKKFFDACGNIEDWNNGYVERLAKNVFSMSLEPHKFPGFSESTFNGVWTNYMRRKMLLERDGKIKNDPAQKNQAES